MIIPSVKIALEVAVCSLLLIIPWSCHQHNKIEQLTQENDAQKELILQQKQVNHRLITELESERQAVEYQQKYANQLKEKVNVTQKSIRQVLKNEPCATTRLPDNAIKRLQQ